MAVNEQNTGQIINGTFTDNSQGATIPTKNLESAMNEANTIVAPCELSVNVPLMI
jgi:hypothetical protein